MTVHYTPELTNCAGGWLGAKIDLLLYRNECTLSHLAVFSMWPLPNQQWLVASFLVCFVFLICSDPDRRTC